MKPINNFIVTVGLTLTLSAITNNVYAQGSNMQEKGEKLLPSNA